ncbi:MAG: hypothetical protein MJY93_00760 [Fibrobacter sp.]|nr:hypothetical protein [Fibrobacter sp.]
MKKIGFISIFLMMTATAFAGESSLRPESSIPTPAIKSEVSQEAPTLGAKESEDWKKLREERRQAREQILSDLRASSAAEKQSIRQEVTKNKPRPRFEGEIPNNSRERQPNFEWQQQQPNPQFPPRDNQFGPRPFEGDRPFH